MSQPTPTSWNVFGPGKLYLDRSEVIVALRSNDKHFRKLIKEGRFPPGIQETAKGEAYWYAQDVACYLYLRSRGMIPGTGTDLPEDEE